jgi:hypothetical protein
MIAKMKTIDPMTPPIMAPFELDEAGLGIAVAGVVVVEVAVAGKVNVWYKGSPTYALVE